MEALTFTDQETNDLVHALLAYIKFNDDLGTERSKAIADRCEKLLEGKIRSKA